MATVPHSELLLVGMNTAENLLTQEGLQEAGVCCQVSSVADGAEALRFLQRERPFAEPARPRLIILNLDLPGGDGPRSLARIKADEASRHVPIVALATSSDERTIRLSYELHANCYVVKPRDPGQFITVVGALARFWLQTALLPRG